MGGAPYSVGVPEPTSALPGLARETTAERPWPVRTLSLKIGDYVARMSALWVEGQVVQLNRRPGMSTVFLTLRDTEVDMSLSLTLPAAALDAMPRPPEPGARVVVNARPTFWAKRGQLMLDGRRLHLVGVGELLARLEHLKALLRSEGLFDAARKRPLPFLPRSVGLITGRGSAAERDVVQNARRRWPAVRFEVRQVPMQGRDCVGGVRAALRDLDALPHVEVVVIARGGGSVEDLLPFSDEGLVRAVAAASTPVVSAIGHETDSPLLDHVADLRASTPTHAAGWVVPDLHEQLTGLEQTLARGRRAARQRVDRERRALLALLDRPVMRDPGAVLRDQRRRLDDTHGRGRRAIAARLEREDDRLAHLRDHLRAVSPGAVLERGYAVVRDTQGHVVRGRDDVASDQLLRVTVADGDFGVRVLGGPARDPDPDPRPEEERAP